MVEFALLAPTFFIMFLGVLDFGRAGYYYVTVSGLARTTARLATTYNTGNGFATSDIQTATQAQVQSEAIGSISTPAGCTAPSGQPTLSCQHPADGTAYYWISKCLSCTPRTVIVNVVYAFTPTTPVIKNLTGTVYINASSKMDLEY